MDLKMKIGTVGTNFIVTRFIEAVRLTGEAEIVASYSRSPETAADFTRKHGIDKVFSDREAFLNSDTFNFVYVASPNSLHYSWTRDALLRGKNVICEKPFVSTVKELEDLIRIVREKRLFLFEALTVPHLPNAVRIRELMKSVGPIHYVMMNFSQLSSRYPAFLKGETPNLFNPEFSGGALMDINYYNIALSFFLFGEPLDIRYFADIASNGIDVSGTVIMKYPGFDAVLSACKNCTGENFVQIQGEGGHIYSTSTSSNLREGFRLRRNTANLTGAGGMELSEPEQFQEQDRPNNLFYEVRDFAKVFQAGDFACRDALLEVSLKIMTLTERARKSAGIVFPADSGASGAL
jgi:predicted dehydrogenase